MDTIDKNICIDCLSNSTESWVLEINNKRQIPNIYRIDHLKRDFALERSSGDFFNSFINCKSLPLKGNNIIPYRRPPSGKAKTPIILIKTVAHP